MKASYRVQILPVTGRVAFYITHAPVAAMAKQQNTVQAAGIPRIEMTFL
jgi:hypothetical protein